MPTGFILLLKDAEKTTDIHVITDLDINEEYNTSGEIIILQLLSQALNDLVSPSGGVA